jgi:cyclic pyranopterin phosphate synthase
MKDNFGREIRYLRLSVTDLCNLRCNYCMPAEGVMKRPHAEILSVEELVAAARAAANCGIRKVRLTGGEPLVRRGIVEICAGIAAIEGIEELCMTTNASLLPGYAAVLREAGLQRLNISLDTLDAEKFRRISRIGELKDTLKGLETAVAAGFFPIKLNAVLMGGVNDDEIRRLSDFAESGGFELRFIELMPIGVCAGWDKERFVGVSKVLEVMPELQPVGAEGVTRLFEAPGRKSRIGLISPMTAHFCPSCDRIRVTADGRLKPCLHSAEEILLRGLHPEQMEEAIRKTIAAKPRCHELGPDSPSQSGRDMNEIGG